MNLSGTNFIGRSESRLGSHTFSATNPALDSPLPTQFYEATTEEVDRAAKLAEAAFESYRQKSGHERAAFLEAIGSAIMDLGDQLIDVCGQETGLPEGRLKGERGRTVGQLGLFAKLLSEGSWVGATIDTALPDRTPFPRPDLRQMQIALGPVAVFGASNFPLAFSVAGGDTASALAAGCPVVVKGHPAHPGTSELIARAILSAAEQCGMPDGVFSMVHGTGHAVGISLVKHPLIHAVGFTGSFRGGRAIYDMAAARPTPIPVYAEMGSTNPVFVLPGALKERGAALAEAYKNSVTLGVGQFCTNPGLAIGLSSPDMDAFAEKARDNFAASTSATMLTSQIRDSYDAGAGRLQSLEGVTLERTGQAAGEGAQGIPRLLSTSAAALLQDATLREEVFGPSSMLVYADSKAQMLEVARGLEGHLTATLQATEDDLLQYRDLIEILTRKVGRLIINGFPTGVEVCHAMVHGGPYPATTDARMTSVGTSAITRFTRPICYQGFSDALLPTELRDENALHIWRRVNGEWTRDAIDR